MSDTSNHAVSLFKSREKLVLITSLNELPGKDSNIVTLILQNYGHVLTELGGYTPGDFAKKIIEAYSLTDLHNLIVVSYLEHLDTLTFPERQDPLLEEEEDPDEYEDYHGGVN